VFCYRPLYEYCIVCDKTHVIAVVVVIVAATLVIVDAAVFIGNIQDLSTFNILFSHNKYPSVHCMLATNEKCGACVSDSYFFIVSL
jgi:hypothetical protein